MLPALTIELLQDEAAEFTRIQSEYPDPSLFNLHDGKSIGTALETLFTGYLKEKYDFKKGSPKYDLDFPDLKVDLKFTSSKKPQSSSPFRSFRQKVFGLEHHLLIFIYTKDASTEANESFLRIDRFIFVDAKNTAAHRVTKKLNKALKGDAVNIDTILECLEYLKFPTSIDTKKIAEDILSTDRLEDGHLTISGAFQWRLKYH